MILRAMLALLVLCSGWMDDVRAQSAPRAGCNGACGVIQSMLPVDERQVWTPLGTVSPGTISSNGLGSTPNATAQMQIGSGFSNKGMVIIGSAGGAAYAQKPSEYRRQRWEVTLKMDDGGTRVVSMGSEPLFVQEGDYVRVSGNNLELVNP